MCCLWRYFYAKRHAGKVAPTPPPCPLQRAWTELLIHSALRKAFPEAVSEAILHGRRPTRLSSECVTVLFADICGFTELSSAMDSEKVADMLTRLYAQYDALAALNGVQKIDIIGDCFLAL